MPPSPPYSVCPDRLAALVNNENREARLLAGIVVMAERSYTFNGMMYSDGNVSFGRTVFDDTAINNSYNSIEIAGSEVILMSLDMAPVDGGGAEAMMVHVNQHGRNRPFKLPMPQPFGHDVLNDPGQSNQLDIAVTPGSTQGTITAGTFSGSERAGKTLLTGSYFNIGTDTKLYQVTEDLDIDTLTAQSILNFFPQYRGTSGTKAMEYDNPMLRARYGQSIASGFRLKAFRTSFRFDVIETP